MLSGPKSFRDSLSSFLPTKAYASHTTRPDSKTQLSSLLSINLEIWGMTRWLRRQRYAAKPGNLSSIPGHPHGGKRELTSCKLSSDTHTYMHGSCAQGSPEAG